MKKTLFIFLIFIGLSLQAEEPPKNKKFQTTIHGQVVDYKNKESLTGVKISYKDTTIYTDFNGEFHFKTIADGTATVRVNYISYNQKDTVLFTGKRNEIHLKQPE